MTYWVCEVGSRGRRDAGVVTSLGGRGARSVAFCAFPRAGKVTVVKMHGVFLIDGGI